MPVVAALVMAFVFTLDGYSFGRNNQMEHLPAIQRLMDESLFAQD